MKFSINIFHFHVISGLFDLISNLLNGLTSGLSTFGTNFMQCLDGGPRIVYSPLDLELPPALRPSSTTTTTEKPLSGNLMKYCARYFS